MVLNGFILLRVEASGSDSGFFVRERITSSQVCIVDASALGLFCVGDEVCARGPHPPPSLPAAGNAVSCN